MSEIALENFVGYLVVSLQRIRKGHSLKKISNKDKQIDYIFTTVPLSRKYAVPIYEIKGFASNTYNDVPIMLVTGTSEFSLFSAFDPRFAKDFTSGDLFKDANKLAELTYAETYGGELYRLANGVESARILSDNYKSDIYVGEIAYGDNVEVTPVLAEALGLPWNF